MERGEQNKNGFQENNETRHQAYVLRLKLNRERANTMMAEGRSWIKRRIIMKISVEIFINAKCVFFPLFIFSWKLFVCVSSVLVIYSVDDDFEWDVLEAHCT